MVLLILYLGIGVTFGLIALELEMVSYAIRPTAEWAKIFFATAGVISLFLGLRGVLNILQGESIGKIIKNPNAINRLRVLALGQLAVSFVLLSMAYGLEPFSQGVALYSWGSTFLKVSGIALGVLSLIYFLPSKQPETKRKSQVQRTPTSPVTPAPETASPVKKKSGRLTIVIFAILIGAFLIPFFIFFYPEIQKDRLIKDGTPAEGVLLKIEDTGNRFNDQPQVKIWLEVYPPDGTPYQTETKMIVSPVYLPQFQPGRRLKLKYDPEDPNRVAIEAIASSP